MQSAASRDHCDGFNREAIGWMNTYLKADMLGKNVIIFIDPPYENIELYQQSIDYLRSNNFQGTVWTEACRQKTMHENDFQKNFYTAKIYRQGTSYIAVGGVNSL